MIAPELITTERFDVIVDTSAGPARGQTIVDRRPALELEIEPLRLENAAKVDVTLDLDVEGRKLSLGHKQTKPNPWDVYEKDFALDTVHKSEISEIIDKGGIISFNDDISAFCPTRHLDKEDGSKLTQGESAEFKVIEFSKEFKRVVVSHMQTHNDSSTEEVVEEKVKEKKSKKKDEE